MSLSTKRPALLCAGPVVSLFGRKQSDKPGYEFKAKSGTEADLYVYDVIGGDWFGEGTTAKGFAADLKAVSGVKRLNIYINSPGGSVFDGVAIYNQLRRFKADKIVSIDGIAASIATVIALAGDEVNIATNGSFMIHNPWGMAIGEAGDMRKVADSLDKVRDAILNTYTDRTGQGADTIGAMMDAETWMTAQEALDLGFVDKITDNQAELAALSKFDLSAFHNVPQPIKEAAEAVPAETEADKPVVHRMNDKIATARAFMAKRGISHG